MGHPVLEITLTAHLMQIKKNIKLLSKIVKDILRLKPGSWNWELEELNCNYQN